MRRFLLAFASAYLAYLICVDRGDTVEYAAGAMAAALAALLCVPALGPRREAVPIRYAPFIRYAGAILRATARELVLVLRGVARSVILREPLRGRFMRVPLDPGGGEPGERLRCACVAWGMAVSPNDYAVALEPEQSAMLVHRLIPDARPPGGGEARWPA